MFQAHTNEAKARILAFGLLDLSSGEELVESNWSAKKLSFLWLEHICS